eukprot:gene25512-58814_t
MRVADVMHRVRRTAPAAPPSSVARPVRMPTALAAASSEAEVGRHSVYHHVSEARQHILTVIGERVEQEAKLAALGPGGNELRPCLLAMVKDD